MTQSLLNSSTETLLNSGAMGYPSYFCSLDFHRSLLHLACLIGRCKNEGRKIFSEVFVLHILRKMKPRGLLLSLSTIFSLVLAAGARYCFSYLLFFLFVLDFFPGLLGWNVALHPSSQSFKSVMSLYTYP